MVVRWWLWLGGLVVKKFWSFSTRDQSLWNCFMSLVLSLELVWATYLVYAAEEPLKSMNIIIVQALPFSSFPLLIGPTANLIPNPFLQIVLPSTRCKYIVWLLLTILSSAISTTSEQNLVWFLKFMTFLGCLKGCCYHSLCFFQKK